MSKRIENIPSQAGAVSSGALGVACAVSACMLTLSLFMHGTNPIAKDAIAAQADDAYVCYLPAQFPVPKGAPESHIEAF